MTRRSRSPQTMNPHADWIDVPSEDLPERDVREDAAESDTDSDGESVCRTPRTPSLSRQAGPATTKLGSAPPKPRPVGGLEPREAPLAVELSVVRDPPAKRPSLVPQIAAAQRSIELRDEVLPADRVTAKRLRRKAEKPLPRGQRWRARRLPTVLAQRKVARSAPPEPPPPKPAPTRVNCRPRRLQRRPRGGGRSSKWRGNR